jgi:hypothetical protein
MLSIRRLDATVSRGHVTVDAANSSSAGARPRSSTPTDRFAPRDYLNVFDTEYLAVPGVRVLGQFGPFARRRVGAGLHAKPQSRCRAKRWTSCRPERRLSRRSTAPFPKDGRRACAGHMSGAATRVSGSFFDGFNHLPYRRAAQPAGVQLVFPSMRMYGGDAVVPSRWITIKAEGGYFTTDIRLQTTTCCT